MKRSLRLFILVCSLIGVSHADQIAIGEIPEILEQSLKQNDFSKLPDIKKTIDSAKKDVRKKLLHELLYQDFFFHKAAEACSIQTIDFFLSYITDSNEIDDFLLLVRRPYGEIQINPYQQAIISSCMDGAIQMDNKVRDLITITLKSFQDPYSDCNSNIHLSIIASGEKGELNRPLIQYLLKDPVAAYLKNIDECRAIDILDQNKQFSNYNVIRYDLVMSSQMGNIKINEKSSEDRLNNCRIGYQSLVAPAKKLNP